MTETCRACEKSGLPILLVRPSVIANKADLQPPGSAKLLSHAIAQKAAQLATPKQSRYVLRTLRRGYLYVFYETPPAGKKDGWDIYRITPEGALYSTSHPSFYLAEPFSCNKSGHLHKVRLLTIPQAHKTGKIWLAYSANLWNDTLKKANQANPKVMQCLDVKAYLDSGKAPDNAFVAKAESPGKFVAEYALRNVSPGKDAEPYFPFKGGIGALDQLTGHMQQLGNMHPKTKDKGLVFALHDPVAVSAELNHLRMRALVRKSEVAVPYRRGVLCSGLLIGLKKCIGDDHYKKTGTTLLDGAQRRIGSMNKALYDKNKLNPSFRPSLKDTIWKPTHAGGPVTPASMGEVYQLEDDALRKTKANERTQTDWAKLSTFFDEPKRAQFMLEYDKKMAEMDQIITSYDDDYAAASQKNVTDCFALHFDENDPNDPKQTHHSAGACYSEEAFHVYGGGSMGPSSAELAYQQALKKITEQDAVMLRAQLSNQKSVFEYVAEDNQAKSYNLLKDLLMPQLSPKFSWLNEAVFGFHQGVSTALIGGAVGYASEHSSFKVIEGKLLGMTLLGQNMEHILAGVLDKTKIKPRPLLVSVFLPFDEAIALLVSKRYTPSKKLMNSMRNQSLIELHVITDTDKLKHATQSATALKDAEKVSLSISRLNLTAEGVAGIQKVSAEDFGKMFAQQRHVAETAKEALNSLKENSWRGSKAVFIKAEGRIAIGFLSLQMLGLNGSLKSLAAASPEDQKALRDAWFGIASNGLGAVGATGELAGIAAAQFAKHGALTMTLKAIGGFAGWGALLVDSAQAFTFAGERFKRNDMNSSFAWISTSALYGLGGFSGMAATGEMVVRWIGTRAIISTAAVASEGVIVILGMSLTGWGLILMGLGVLASSGSAMLTPTELEDWAEDCFFGKVNKFHTAAEEERALLKALHKSNQAAPEPQSKYDVKQSQRADKSAPASVKP
ncbi:T6SS effector BTH_I2691 family protein [Iodobacter sp. CM08]|uniref:T6SS effector BTH_I2691 family protein n=1 Tax=Iodobacter sp. CM08 TaxID=3085902 RepID=UPI0029813E55|nr:T6SS effector BTH_I2691 family protein [Iodobacter sp. CM08]MDW5419256.1 T6SS effector BTH_I2691 family protein [Iodobacter sp. CM08]